MALYGSPPPSPVMNGFSVQHHSPPIGAGSGGGYQHQRQDVRANGYQRQDVRAAPMMGGHPMGYQQRTRGPHPHLSNRGGPVPGYHHHHQTGRAYGHQSRMPEIDPDEFDERGYSALYRAAAYGMEQNVKHFLAAGAHVNLQNPEGRTAMHIAALNGESGCIRLLINARGVNLNLQAKDGWTALHIASLYGKVECVKALVEAGADLEIRMKDGCTALHCASTNLNESCMKILLDSGSRVNIQNKAGHTPLHLASFYGKERFVKVVLDGGAEIDLSPHIEALNTKESCIRHLVDSGADATIKEFSGKSCVDYARVWETDFAEPITGHSRRDRLMWKDNVASVYRRIIAILETPPRMPIPMVLSNHHSSSATIFATTTPSAQRRSSVMSVSDNPERGSASPGGGVDGAYSNSEPESQKSDSPGSDSPGSSGLNLESDSPCVPTPPGSTSGSGSNAESMSKMSASVVVDSRKAAEQIESQQAEITRLNSQLREMQAMFAAMHTQKQEEAPPSRVSKAGASNTE